MDSLCIGVDGSMCGQSMAIDVRTDRQRMGVDASMGGQCMAIDARMDRQRMGVDASIDSQWGRMHACATRARGLTSRDSVGVDKQRESARQNVTADCPRLRMCVC
eukprot:269784-Chlamydomonas_euryale.AAC.2